MVCYEFRLISHVINKSLTRTIKIVTQWKTEIQESKRKTNTRVNQQSTIIFEPHF